MAVDARTVQPHGDVQYWYDGIQQLIGVLPRTCRTGGHDLHYVGYTHEYVNRPGQHRLIVVRCPSCRPPDDCWVLVQSKERPFRVELDDSWYESLRQHTREPVVD
jgi:hypothetical protein